MPREIGDHAVISISSCKQGFGVENLRDESALTYWQSDGAQPHYINLEFVERVVFHELVLYVDREIDESYTPNILKIYYGDSNHHLTLYQTVNIESNTHDIKIPLAGIKGFVLQIKIIENQQNGKDTHIRLLKIYGDLL